jgi:hypothetical protein
VDSEGQALEVSDSNEDSIGKWTGDHVGYILAKNLSRFCLCPETLWKTEFKARIITCVCVCVCVCVFVCGGTGV